MSDSLSALAAARTRLLPLLGAEEAEASAVHLLAAATGIGAGALRAKAFPVAEEAQQRYVALVERRAQGEPVAYIEGRQGFWRHEFLVSPAVLIPRPETERLVEIALEQLPVDRPARVLDACTGSGCVAICLALERPGDIVFGSDLSAAALDVARQNATVLAAHVQWFEADGLPPPAASSRFDLITANPPYIAAQDRHLDALRHEPRLALVSGVDGLDLIRRLIEQAPAALAPGGTLLLEHGYDQAAAVRALLTERGFTAVQTWRDLGGQERVSGGRWP